MRTLEEIKHQFKPVNMDQVAYQKGLKVQAALQEAAEMVMDLVPDCPDRTHALRQILDAKFWSIQAISHQLPAQPQPKASTSNEKTAQKTN